MNYHHVCCCIPVGELLGGVFGVTTSKNHNFRSLPSNANAILHLLTQTKPPIRSILNQLVSKHGPRLLPVAHACTTQS